MESSGRTLVCSVLFLDIVEYSKKPVAEQLELKQAFNKLLANALEEVPQRDRIILDTGDGAAVTFMGDPEDALFASIAVRDHAAAVPVRLGVNLGPVRLVKDLNDQVNIIGDGINVAQRVMSFARPGQLLVSRSFYEVVSCLSRDYAKLFHHEGARTDKHVREHDVYSVGADMPATRRLGDTFSQTADPEEARPWFAGTGPFGLRRSALLIAPVLFLLIVAGGVGARVLMPEAPRAAGKPLPHALAAGVPVAVVAPAPADGAAAATKMAHVEKKPERAEKTVAGGSAGGRVELAIAPWGEVLVDGKRRGVSPPLRVLEVGPGPHTVEIRNATFPAHVEKVQVNPGEAVRIRHRFR
jgi:hypothetical protein